MLRTRIFIDCDGGCGTTAEMSGDTTQPLITLVESGWTVPVSKPVNGEPMQHHYCPMCSRARLTGTI